ncbi:MAG: threonylcarbamoyl-AMP synthase [Candidatus Omnitrophica bacterium]|nr:threonylcarbamoyl-AMP synthase [Candidatus Omnitrophota bacterium]
MQTKIVKVNPHSPNRNVILEAVNILQKGGIVAFPTETVYGLAADYNNKEAVNKLYEIKKRPKDKPFTIHIATKEKITEYIDSIDELTKKLIDKFWPGPLTIIVKSKKRGTLGFRMPSNTVAVELINLSNLTLAVPSANISGRPEPVEPFSVVNDFDGLIDMVIDAGPTEIGTASTIVDLTSSRPKILREGRNAEAIRRLLHEHAPDNTIMNILVVCTGNSCRSPMAEGLFKQKLSKEGFNIKSAGIIAADGLSPTGEAVEAMKRYANVNISGYLSSRLTKELIKWADLILVMEKAHKYFIEESTPEAKNKIHIFKEYAGIPDSNPDVPDPIGKPFLTYEQSYRQIEEGVNRITRKLKGE